MSTPSEPISVEVTINEPETVEISQFPGPDLGFSLVGPQGPRGTPGAPGTDGVDGSDGAGVLPGGITGQALTKNSSADFDTKWADPTNALATLTDVNLAVSPANGEALVYDLATSKWKAGSSGSALTVRDEGAVLNNTVADIDFVGAGITATYANSKVTVNIPGGLTGLNYSNPSPTGLSTISAPANGSSEVVVPGMSVTNLQPGITASVNLLLWVSMSSVNSSKQVTLKIRDGGVTGAVLFSTVKDMSTDSTSGHDQSISYGSSVTPSTNTIVVTIQRTAASMVDVWSDTRTFSVTQATGGTVPPGGSSGLILSKRSANDFDTAWMPPPGAGVSYTNPSPSGNIIINSSTNGTTEVAVSGMQASGLSPGISVTVDLALWVSMSNSAVAKQVTMRLRDGSITGPVLASAVKNMTAESTAGHNQSFAFTGTVVPSTSIIFVTVQRTGSSTVDVWSDTRTFSVTQSGGGHTPPGGAAGQVLVKNSANDFDAGWATAGTSGPAVAPKSVVRTSGGITLNSTTWTLLAPEFEVIIAAAVGDVLEVGMNGRHEASTIWGHFDVFTYVGGAALNALSGATWTATTGEGMSGWEALGSNQYQPFGGSGQYTVKAADVVNGVVTLRVMGRCGAAGSRALAGAPGLPLQFYVTNLSKLAASSGGWKQLLDLPGTSLTGLGSTTGTWVIDGTDGYLRQTAGGDAFAAVSTDAINGAVVFQADLKYNAAVSSPVRAGLSMGPTGASGGTFFYLERSAANSYTPKVERYGQAVLWTGAALTLTDGSWVTVKLVSIGLMLTVFVNNTQVVNLAVSGQVSNLNNLFLDTVQSGWSFRNMKAWRQALPGE